MKPRGTILSGSLSGEVEILRNLTPGDITVTDLEDPDITRESTDHFLYFEPGMVDPGNCTYLVKYRGEDVGDYAKARQYLRVPQTFTIIHPDNATEVCSGYYKRVQRPTAGGEDETLVGEIEIKWSGEPVFNDISASTSPSPSASASPSASESPSVSPSPS